MIQGSELSVLYLERKDITYKPNMSKSIANKLSTQLLGNAKQQTPTLERIHWADNGEERMSRRKDGTVCYQVSPTFANGTGRARVKI